MPEAMNPTLVQILKAAEAKPLEIGAFVSSHHQELTIDMAREAHDEYLSLLKAGNFGSAGVAALVAGHIYLKLGNRTEGLRNYLNFSETLFTLANGAEQYEEAYRFAVDCIGKAAEIQAEDLRFWATALAADCALFIGEAGPNVKPTPSFWLIESLRLAVDAVENAKDKDPHEVNFERVLALIPPLLRSLEKPLMIDNEPKVKSLAGRLATAVEQRVPADFEFPGDPERTNDLAQALGVLEASHISAE